MSKSKRNISYLILLTATIILLGQFFIITGGTERYDPKAYDSQIKSLISALRPATELFFGKNGESYGNPSQSCYNENSIFKDPDVSYFIKKIETTSQHKAVCFSNPKAWAVSTELRSEIVYYCSDSTGFSGDVIKNITSPSCAPVKIGKE